MKLHGFLIALACAAVFTSCAKETTTHDASILPEQAKNILNQNFKSGVSLVEIETKGIGDKEYEVTLTDGSEITFTSSGEWTNIETPNNKAVPEGLVPTTIANYVRQKHAGTSIVGIEKDKKGFDVELSNNIEIKFDPAGNFVKYDN